MKDKRAFIAATLASQKDGDDSLVYPFLARAVKTWPYALNPALPESYDELGMLDYREVTEQVAEAFKRYIRPGS